MPQNRIKSGIDKSYLDTSVSPRDDFYEYAVGGWRKKNPIPKDESKWGTFYVLRDKNRKELHGLLEDLTHRKDIKAGSDFEKLRNFYLEAMDEKKLNSSGSRTLTGKIHAINSIKDRKDLIKLIVEFQKNGLPSLWYIDADQDKKKSGEIVLYLAQGGLGLPDRDYYLDPQKKSEEIRQKYQKHIERMFALLDPENKNASKFSKIIFDLEKRLAKSSMTRTEQRDPLKLYHKKTLKELKSLFPEALGSDYFHELGLSSLKSVIVMQPVFFETINKIINETPLDNLKIYFKWKLLNGSASFLSNEFVNESFDFYGRVLNGVQEIKPRWKRVTSFVDDCLGEVLGKLYVEKYFSETAKIKVNELVDYLFIAYEKRIKSLDWMSAKTKKKALLKLRAIVRKLGYPDKWRDYRKLKVGRGSYLENYFKIAQFEFDRDLKKIGLPVDRTEWHMSPATVNAYYHPTLLDIVFPAGILQPPFFDPDADMAANFGSIGAVIGHEITHGFDDEGGKFDSHGNLKNWWTKEDKKLFEKKTRVLKKQFDKCEALPGEFVNGKLTLGENVADLGGASLAYDALKIYMEDHGNLPNLDGFTPEQRFFISLAVFEAQNSREEQIRQQLIIDPHSPGNFRINIPLSNMEEFYEAFDVKEGDKMYRAPKDRAKIW